MRQNRTIAVHSRLIFLLVVTLIGVMLDGIWTVLSVEHAFYSILTLSAGLFVLILIGLVLYYILARGLQNVETALTRLANGQPNQPIVAGKYSALLPLYELVNRLSAQATDYSQATHAVGQARQQWLDQLRDTAAQEERNRLARDLHDSIKQQIFSIKASAAAVQARWEHDPAGAWAALADVRRSAQEAQTEMTALLQQLRPAPLATVGLVAALRDQCEALSYRTGAEVETTFGDVPPAERLPAGAQEAIFRIAQEALANVARHARAHHVRVRLFPYDDTTGEALWLEINDDGQGFDMATVAQGMGTRNITERAQALGGKAEFYSAPGGGTTLRVRIPLINPAQFDDAQPTQTATGIDIILARHARLRILAGALPLASVLYIGLTHYLSGVSDDIQQVFHLNHIVIFSFACMVAAFCVLRLRRLTHAMQQDTPYILAEQSPASSYTLSGLWAATAFAGLPLLPLNLREWPYNFGDKTNIVAFIGIACAIVLLVFMRDYFLASKRYYATLSIPELAVVYARNVRWHTPVFLIKTTPVLVAVILVLLMDYGGTELFVPAWKMSIWFRNSSLVLSALALVLIWIHWVRVQLWRIRIHAVKAQDI